MNNLKKEIEFVDYKRECSYFNNELSDIIYKYMDKCTMKEYQNMLVHGWRRFGKMHFAPECEGCHKCISMRIDVKKYKFSSSQKRVLVKNSDTKVIIQKPSISIDHLKLYDKYHYTMNKKKRWAYSSIEAHEYIKSYLEGELSWAREILYIRDEKLIAVALCDILPKAISSIYCYYDHAYEKYSIGKYSILSQIKIAKELNIPYIYLGYWIKDHLSMGYKKEYQPFEILVNRAPLNKMAFWKEYESKID